MNYVIFITRNLENVPGKSGVGQGKVSEKSGKNCVQSLWEPCMVEIGTNAVLYLVV